MTYMIEKFSKKYKNVFLHSLRMMNDVNLLIINTLTSCFPDAYTELNNITAKFHNTLVTTAKMEKDLLKDTLI